MYEGTNAATNDPQSIKIANKANRSQNHLIFLLGLSGTQPNSGLQFYTN